MANDCIPYYRPGEDITFKAGGAITGKRFLKVSGSRTSGPGLATTAEGSVYQLVQATAGVRAVGVAMMDVASGALGTFISSGIVPVKSGNTITAGAEVESDASGQAIPLASGKALGICMTAVTNSGDDAEILLYG